MKLIFKGKVTSGDSCRTGGEPDGAYRVGDDDVILRLLDLSPEKKFTVAIADERFEGHITGELGWGYSEWTPMDSDELRCGPHNLIEALAGHEGKEITMWVSDEPINVLEQS